jgi:cell wall assembly regulator SMI1
MRTDLNWQKCGPPLSEEAVHTIEERLGVSFPPDYRACVKQCDGGWPKPRYFDYPDPSLGPVESCIGRFLSLDENREGNILAVVGWLSEQLPPGVVPIANDPGGDYVCFDYRSGATPTVVYWMHEESGDEAIVPLAPTFSAFLDRLRSASPDAP